MDEDITGYPPRATDDRQFEPLSWCVIVAISAYVAAGALLLFAARAIP